MTVSAQPCLPGDYDRFNPPSSCSTNHGLRRPTEQSWVVIQKAPSIGFDDPKKDTTKDISAFPTTHPEGSPIHFAGCVVSNQPVDETLQAFGHSLLERAGLKPSDCNATAFVMPDGPRVRYYLINHATRAVVWANGDGVPTAVSTVEPQRAQNMLCEEYWMHMENFPAPVPASAEDLRQLKVVLASMAVDSSTSDGSTSPFCAAQIQEFLAMLNMFSGNIEMFQTYTIARLWCMIWHARAVNNFGTTNSSLDRFTVLSEKPLAFSGSYASWAKLFVGAGADAHLARCSRAWAGRIAYVTEWRNFKSKNELEWTQVMYMACVLIVASLLARGQSTLRLIPNTSLAFGCASAANSFHLVNESRNLGEHAADALHTYSTLFRFIMNHPKSVEETPASRTNAPSSNQPASHGTRPAPGAINALLHAANQAYAELMEHEAEEQRKREASETLVGLQWRYA
ncbi:hypothetical protein FRC06_000492 [Ceratobasidium sp. 370]|nr:hypothetical protein FRC06_000492 [Ceratobasidium sp. 370]